MHPQQLPAWAPVLSDGSVTLRAHGPQDVDGVLAQCTDPVTQRWTTVPVPYRRSDAEEFVAGREREWNAGRYLGLAVEVDGRFAGTVDVRPDGARAASVGYGLGPWARGSGITTRALRLLLPWALEALDLDVVHWEAVAGNWGSRKVAWSVGFRVEGTVRGLLADRGHRADAWLGSLCRSDPLHPVRPWHTPPELTGPGVLLRPHGPDDAAPMALACADPAIQYWLPQLPSPYEVLDAQAHLEHLREAHATGDGLYWAVCTPDGALIGEVGLFGLAGGASRSAELGYWTHPGHRRNRLTTTAVRLAARHALLPVDVGGLGLARVVIRAAEGNLGSQRVALGAGFRPAGVDRAAELLRGGQVADLLRFDLIAQECPW